MNPHEVVERFCVRKLAHILFENVFCSHEKRDHLDWFTAQGFVQNHSHIVHLIYRIFQLQIDKAGILAPDFNDFDTLCGRAVWDGLYQSIWWELNFSDSSEAHYTSVRYT